MTGRNLAVFFIRASRDPALFGAADGWYEWTKGEDGGRDPWFIHLAGTAPFSFAGLWAHNTKLDVISCTILTAPAVAPIDQVHTRMPIVLDQSAYDGWLEPQTPGPDAKALLASNMGTQFEFNRVGRQVNSSNTDEAEMVEPVEA